MENEKEVLEKKILILVSRCEEITAVLGITQYEEENISVGEKDWCDLIYGYSRGKLDITTHYLCDGPFILGVYWDQEIVLAVDESRGYEDVLRKDEPYRRIDVYKPGFWETKINALYRTLPPDPLPIMRRANNSSRIDL